jgi:galactokinase
VNLIGEHTDYNGGVALPFAIDRGVTAIAAPAAAFDPVAAEVAAELGVAGLRVARAEVQIRSPVPTGAGLASSAALTVAVALALLSLAGLARPAPLELARICQAVEHRRGARTGLLDQLASICGRAGQAVLIDFGPPAWKHVPLSLPPGWKLGVLDSGDRHDHAAAGGYRARRQECERACALLGVRALSQADAEAAEALPPPLDRRARYVLAENERVRRAVEALDDADMAALGALLNASHAGLRDLYDVSTPAVERTRERLLAAGCSGARIMGGGFGGAVLGLLAPGAQPPRGALVVTACDGASIQV